MVTSVELKFRTLDSLIDSVRLDLRTWDSDGVIDAQDLIKVAQKCNYEIGLNILQTKETILEIEHGRTNLPADFHFMNFALLCHNYKVMQPGPNSGNMTVEQVTYNLNLSPNLTTCPCWTVVVTAPGVQTKVTTCDGIVEGRFFPANDDGSPRTTKICASYIDTSGAAGGGTISVSTSSFCYNDPNTATFTCDIPVNCDCTTPAIDTCAVVKADPWKQNKVYTICDGTIGIKVMQICTNECREYEYFSPVYMIPSRQVSAFMNPRLVGMNAPNQAMLRDGFMQFALPCGQVYINYQGIMEDDEGNLLVLDHPKINFFYEWAFKKTILENLYINGEPDIERRLQYVNTEYQKAKIDAITIVNTPDHRVMTETFQIIRKNAAQRFAAPVSRYWGSYAGISFIDQLSNGKFAE